MIKQKEKIVVGMSGGIDSAMSLILLKEQGWEPIGVSLKLPVWQNKANLLRENICCTKESLKIAAEICEKIKAPFYVLDTKKEFQKQVIKYFVSELKAGRTPNPCIICNPVFKFKQLFAFAKKMGIKYVATGHYARIKFNKRLKKYQLLKAKDKTKDQTYTLSFLPAEWLKYTVFPLGDYLKKEVFVLAKNKGLNKVLKKPQSQDFCFVAQKSLGKFIKKEIKPKPGFIVDEKGKKLGKHKGLALYTIGQRQGLGLSGGPFYVKEKDMSNNNLVVTKNKKSLYSKIAWLSPFNFVSIPSPSKKIKVEVKTRYTQPLAEALLYPEKNKKLKIEFIKPQRAVTLGQFAVFYQDNICLGGGRIIKSS